MMRAGTGWIVYCIKHGELAVLGIYPTEEAAKKELELLDDYPERGRFDIVNAAFLGWGHVSHGWFMTKEDCNKYGGCNA